MRVMQTIGSILVLLLASGYSHADERPANALASYNQVVKPLLRSRCYACHGGLKQEAGLRLDTVALQKEGGDSGPAIQPGDAAKSLLIQRTAATDDEERMPPEGKPLSGDEIAAIRSWIQRGAPHPANEAPEADPRDHWSFQPPRQEPLPQLTDLSQDWMRTPIDAFIAQAYEQRELQPVGDTDRGTLLRRVYLNLTGTPPSRTELLDFLADNRPDAYERVVDRLLSSPQHGEFWARHWIDVWLYSDWYGRRSVNDVRNSYPHIWRWRDWIIRSLSDDAGYDRMIVSMRAADEAHPENDEQLPALGFIVRNWYSLNYDQWMKDLVEHTGKGFLGLRLNCAHCHDHKYDPINQEEYFRFRAFFEPLEFRHDRVPGGPELTKYVRYKPGSGASLKPIAAGLARVYDHNLKAQTRMYRLGDARDLFDREPVEPAGPAILQGDNLNIQPIDLPATAWYPGLKPALQRDTLDRRAAAVSAAAATLAKHRAKLPQVESDLRVAMTNLQRAQQNLKAAESQTQPTKTPPLSGQGVVGHWRFEGAGDAFLADSSAAKHPLAHVVGGDPRTKPVEIGADGIGAQFLAPPKAENHQAAYFDQRHDFAYLATEPSEQFTANEVSLLAQVHFTAAAPNFNRVIANVDRGWTFAHRGIDAATFELRVILEGGDGERLDLATGQGEEGWTLQKGRDYFVAMTIGGDRVSVFARDLSGSDLLTRQWSRSSAKRLTAAMGDRRLRIGNSDGTGRVVGAIDEVRVVTRELSAGEIAASCRLSELNAERAALRAAGLASKQAQLAFDSVRKQIDSAQAAQTEAAADEAAWRARFVAEEMMYADRAPGDSGELEQLVRTAIERLRAHALAKAHAQLAAGEMQLIEASRLADATKRVAAEKQAKQSIGAATAAVKAAAAVVKSPVDAKVKNLPPSGPTYPRQSTGRRLALANWIANRDNPLTARVAVNHIWMRHFGEPLATPTYDLGRAGQAPTHTELLDWLAVELMESGWSMKHIHRLIVTSRVYRLSAGAANSESLASDRDNQYLWRWRARRMTGEAVRDSVLVASGSLDYRLGGPELPIAAETTSRRRSVYFTVHPEAGGAMQFTSLFDAPDPSDCYRRTISIVPQQSLAMVNSRLVRSESRLAAARIRRELASAEPTADEFIRAAFEHLLSRSPRADELQRCRQFLTTQQTVYEKATATDLRKADKSSTPPAADLQRRAEESLVRALLNLNDFVTIR
ncbi:MAG: DUF1553 domain-containing protein [Pirellulaceae bacterium]|nr:DUF1553 domain-containing protein [Pirellulaceae bacterium]